MMETPQTIIAEGSPVAFGGTMQEIHQQPHLAVAFAGAIYRIQPNVGEA